MAATPPRMSIVSYDLASNSSVQRRREVHQVFIAEMFAAFLRVMPDRSFLAGEREFFPPSYKSIAGDYTPEMRLLPLSVRRKLWRQEFDRRVWRIIWPNDRLVRQCSACLYTWRRPPRGLEPEK